MTRAEAIRILDPETCGKEMNEIMRRSEFGGRTAVIQAITYARKLAVADMREMEKRRWIPVTKIFPKTGAVVLVFSNKDGINIGKYVGYGAFVVRKWGKDTKPARTTHWMPLPAPPKEDA